jgi:peptidoglycan/LPS O-acetylase OafA/YrhL
MSHRLVTAHAPERLHGLDALRGGALLLGLVVHASMAFLPGARFFWLVHDSAASTPLGLAFFVPHMFRMLLFFLLAGFFARMSLHRLGTAGFVRDRLRRIGVPLLVGWPITLAALTAVIVWNALLQNGGQLPSEHPPGPAFTPQDFPLTHLWFLYVLLGCYAVALALRGIVGRIDRRDRTAAVARSATWLAGPAGPWLLAVPLAVALATRGGWYAWFGIPTPDNALLPNLPASIGFGSAFAFGWALQAGGTGLARLQGRWPWHLATAIVATLGCLHLRGLAPFLAHPESGDAGTWSYAALYALGAWSWVFGLCGFALRHLARPSAARRRLADASYWIYLWHLPLVLALQVVATRIALPPALEAALVAGIAFALLFASHALCVRGTVIGRFLGARAPRPADADAPG